jgi:hypothetical protein
MKKKQLIRNLRVYRRAGGDFTVGTLSGSASVQLQDGANLFGHMLAGGERKLRFLDRAPVQVWRKRYVIAVGVRGGALIFEPYNSENVSLFHNARVARVQFCSQWREKLGLQIGKMRWAEVL